MILLFLKLLILHVFRKHKPEPTDDPTEALPEASFFVEVDLETLD